MSIVICLVLCALLVVLAIKEEEYLRYLKTSHTVDRGVTADGMPTAIAITSIKLTSGFQSV